MARPRARLAAVELPRADLETRVTDDHHDSLRIWLRLLACTHLIEARVRQNLQGQFGTTLPRFDLMAQLERAPAGLKMTELSRRMMVTGGNITGITDLLEKEGLVVRDADPDDRRAYRVKLTKEGSRAFGRMAAEHERWIVGLFEGLSAREKQTLGELLARLKRHVASNSSLQRS
ncbi:MAG TPA: MarR family transcriptional regulator [Steroidobacteraceae bacterium]|nr:MarR family transcriptional regulator [Steroidobacteraceae bacterium]